jgi:hypothetical protein
MTIPANPERIARQDLAVIGIRVLDDAHMNWIAAEADAEHALRVWFEAATPHRADAYLAYRAAVDREEAAAHDLQRLHALTRPFQEQLEDGR